jgi:hypothetical protein
MKDVAVGSLGVQWDASFNGDNERRLKHELKMSSKDNRPAAHVEMMGTRLGNVIHIEIE